MKSNARDLILFPVLWLFGGLACSLILYVLAALWLLPTLCTLIPPLADIVDGLDDAGKYRLGLLMQSIASLIGVFPAGVMTVSCLFGRRTAFAKDTNGLISPREGVRYYLKRYAVTDLACIGAMVLSMYILMLMGNPNSLIVALLMGTAPAISLVGKGPALPLLLIIHALGYFTAVRRGLCRWRIHILLYR